MQATVERVVDEQAVAQQELNKYIEVQSETIAPEQPIEIDSDYDPRFGTMYRVWHSFHLLGTFYQDLDGKWIAQPCNSEFRPRLNTPDQAQLVIIASYCNLAVATAA
ncbi:hypothetical protein WA1_18960 [Scytonema hofmannii PCC 7110]|uniref:Uncharacterized protein n=1 Tax=Scytonema hofmannii PCC 7110 TaxID=128403 RepID=A0A139XD84_9CYAN|nr:hypothetical protein WA1_18960 [Scytonema hofmannii PCC 7110]